MASSWAGVPCLVVGGAGNLGTYIVKLLKKRGAAISVFDIVQHPDADADVKSYMGDICDRSALEQAMQGAKVVFHTASLIDVRPVVSAKMYTVNIDGTNSVLECCKKCGVSTLIYTSSLEVVSGYGPNGEVHDHCGTPEDDESLPIPQIHYLPYAKTKADAEAAVLAANGLTNQLRTAAIRSGYILGPSCIGLRISMTQAVKMHFNNYVCAKLPTRISCVHVQNCALAHILAAERILDDNVAGHAFFVHDFEHSVVELTTQAATASDLAILVLPLWLAFAFVWCMEVFYRFMVKFCGLFGYDYPVPSHVVSLNAFYMGFRHLCYSNKRAQTYLSYTSSLEEYVSPEDCLNQTVSWAKEYVRGLAKKTHEKHI